MCRGTVTAGSQLLRAFLYPLKSKLLGQAILDMRTKPIQCTLANRDQSVFEHRRADQSLCQATNKNSRKTLRDTQQSNR